MSTKAHRPASDNFYNKVDEALKDMGQPYLKSSEERAIVDDFSCLDFGPGPCASYIASKRSPEPRNGLKNNKETFKNRTLEELLPPGPLRHKWATILDEKRKEQDATERQLKFQFGHGWLLGLVDAQILSSPDRDDLRELLIAAKPS
jgi:hypothetical protein